MKRRQEYINKMLKRIKSRRSPFIIYGKIFKIKLSHALLFIDVFIPSFKLLSLYALKYCPEKEIIRISIKK